ncbi:NleE/OspZ family T3SS effector cysteine methyltransferase, partial [Escherichia coli]|nr:NleE/OspZ family T3SS effector cysteine methyltransferase [Escherichia coli]
MINPVTNTQGVSPINTKHAEHVVKNIYPKIKHDYFNESPNIYDKKYISGKRPMGQFSVDSLYNPDLHALCELPDICCKIFPKENNDFLYIVVVYRNDSPLGEQRANRFIELYNIKRDIMQELNYELPELKAVKSEMIIAREMGEIFS